MKELPALLASFHEAFQCGVVVWVDGERGEERVLASAPRPVEPPPRESLPPAGEPGMVSTADGPMLATLLPGPRRAWLAVGPTAPAGHAGTLERYLAFLGPVVAHQLQAALEVEHAATELAERYEEINLLYTISEILGRTVSLDEVAQVILREISETVGAECGAILVHDRVTDTLQAVAVLDAAAVDVPPIAVDDENSVSALVFRTQHPRLVDGGEAPYEAERLYRRGPMLSVPIMLSLIHI